MLARGCRMRALGLSLLAVLEAAFASVRRLMCDGLKGFVQSSTEQRLSYNDHQQENIT